jgi:UDP-N-acetylglucosamine 2-epimerase
MTLWVAPAYAREVVNKAAHLLLSPHEHEYENDFDIISNWRAAHSFPLNTFKIGLLKRARLIDERSVVAQRLKRRLLTDQLADMLFTPSPDADENLLLEGIEASRIHRIGNVMIDSVVRFLALPLAFPIPDDSYALVTLHRPSNVDNLAFLRQILVTLSELSRDLTIIFPVHPRTRQRIAELGLPALSNGRLHLLDPAPYVEFLHLQRHATVVITVFFDSFETATFRGNEA